MPDSLLKCKVTPKAKKSAILGWMEDETGLRRLRVKLAAPPVDGKANQELVKFLSKQLGLPKSRLKLVAGEKSRLKTVQVMGMDERSLSVALTSGSQSVAHPDRQQTADECDGNVG